MEAFLSERELVGSKSMVHSYLDHSAYLEFSFASGHLENFPLVLATDNKWG